MLGRPTVMTPKTLDKLREAFLMGCNDKEACVFADISKSTLYDYEKENNDYSDQKETYKSKPVLLARQTIIKAIKNGDIRVSMWYLERKARDEFGRTNKIDKVVDIEYELDKLEKTNYSKVADQIELEDKNQLANMIESDIYTVPTSP
jgi:hypothetical protein